MKVAIYTLGCKVNQYESDILKQQFGKRGYEIAGANEPADIYIVNTCTVTSLADRKSRQYIRRMKKKNPDAVVAVTGCYVQISPDDVAAIEGVDIIAGIDEKTNLIKYIEEVIAERREESDHRDRSSKNNHERAVKRYVRKYEELSDFICGETAEGSSERTRAYIKIQEGCNRFCSYCVIPYARGKVRSRDEEDILKEVRNLVKNGYREVVLTGINTALYGVDFDGRLHLDELLSSINHIEGNFRIRLSSLEPTVVNAEYVKEILKNEKLCHHLHLSLQSGSDKILKSMNRRYDIKEYLEIIRVLRDFDSDYGVTTDIIAGFPGETEDDFQESLDLIEKAQFEKVHPFKYSVRPGTVAEKMDEQIPPHVKKERVKMLEEAGEKTAAEFNKSQKNTVRTVLTEQLTEDGRFVTGYTDNYIKVYLEPGNIKMNEFYQVSLGELFEEGMKGQIVSDCFYDI